MAKPKPQFSSAEIPPPAGMTKTGRVAFDALVALQPDLFDPTHAPLLLPSVDRQIRDPTRRPHVDLSVRDIAKIHIEPHASNDSDCTGRLRL